MDNNEEMLHRLRVDSGISFCERVALCASLLFHHLQI